MSNQNKAIKDEFHQIYLVTNTVNGKRYVGLTKLGLDTRWKYHVRDSKNNKITCYHRAFMRAIRKYGEENFSIEVIDTASNVFEAGEKESYWISKLEAKGKNGYNLTSGGEGVKGWVPSEKDRLRLSLQNLGAKNYWYGKHTKYSPHYGKALTTEHKEKLRKNNHGNQSITINGVNYPSHSVAAEELNVGRSSIKTLAFWEESAHKITCERLLMDGRTYFGVKNLARELGTSAYKIKALFGSSVTRVRTPWTFDQFLSYTRELRRTSRPLRYNEQTFKSIREASAILKLDRDVVLRMIRDGEIVEEKETLQTYTPSHNAQPVEFCGTVFPSKTKLMEFFKISAKEFTRLLCTNDIVEIAI